MKPVEKGMLDGPTQLGDRFGPSRIFSAAELMAEELLPVRWVVPGLLPEGVTLLAGKPKLGKSWLALGLGIAVASGGVALGTKQVERGDVLYLALEDNPRRLQGRLKKMLAGGEAPKGLYYATEWPRMDEGGSELLENWLGVNPHGRLMVVDILKRVRPLANSARNRSVYDADYEALQSLQSLASEYGVAILVVHHTRKLAAVDPVDEVSGSTGLSGGADGILVLKRDRGRADAYLHVTGREIEEEAELALRWDANLASWSLAGDADEYRHSNERQQIVETLQNAEVLMSPKEIADATEKTVGSVKVLLGEMVKAGQVANPTYGKYGLPSRTPYSPYSANSDSKDESKSKESEQSKDTYDTADAVVCLHGYPGGAGCYLCDPTHSYRLKQGE